MDHFDTIPGDPVIVEMEFSRGRRHRDNPVVEPPMPLAPVGVRGRDTWRATYPAKVQAEDMRARHMRMDEFDSLRANHQGDPMQFIEGTEAQIGFDNLHLAGAQLLSYPGLGTAQDSHRMPAPRQFACEEQAMDDGAVDTISGYDLHQLHDAHAKARRRAVPAGRCGAAT
jgi:hypothetical protein